MKRGNDYSLLGGEGNGTQPRRVRFHGEFQLPSPGNRVADGASGVPRDAERERPAGRGDWEIVAAGKLRLTAIALLYSRELVTLTDKGSRRYRWLQRDSSVLAVFPWHLRDLTQANGRYGVP